MILLLLLLPGLLGDSPPHPAADPHVSCTITCTYSYNPIEQKIIIQLSRARLQQCFTFLLVVESVLDVNRLRGQNSHRCNPFFIRSMYFLLMMIIEKKSNKVILHFTNSSSASLSP